MLECVCVVAGVCAECVCVVRVYVQSVWCECMCRVCVVAGVCVCVCRVCMCGVSVCAECVV